MNAARILHTGQAIVDVVLEIGALPEPGGDTYAHHHDITAGGGTNVMTAAARDGGEVVYLGAIGDGPFGRIVRDALTADHINIPNAPVTSLDTGFCVALVDASAERTFVSTLGAEGCSDLTNLQVVEPTCDDVVYVTGYSMVTPTNRDALISWLPGLPSGTRVVVDPCPMIDEVPDEAFEVMRRHTTLWSLNAREGRLVLARLAPGMDASALGNPELAEQLATVLDAEVVLRSGPEGCHHCLPGGQSVHVPGMEVEPVDTNGAGDSHTGVMMAALSKGLDMETALRRANAAAAIAVTRRGPATSPTTDEIDAALETPGV